MNAIQSVGAVAARVVAKAAQRKQLREAHMHASEFHAALERAFECEEELTSYAEDETDRPYWQAEYKKALGDAAFALQKMPLTWQAVLAAEMPQP